MSTKYETVEDIIADRDRLREAVMCSEGEWVGHKTLASLRKDAERYRWLRDNERADVRIVGVGKRSGAELDSTIDASVLGAA